MATAISTALAAETDAVITGASFAADTGTLTLTLSDGGPVTADLSGLTTAAELTAATDGLVSNVSALTSANIPDDATDAAGLSVTTGDVTTSIKLPSLTHNISPVYTRLRTDRPNCIRMNPAGPPIPDAPLFFVITSSLDSNGYYSSQSYLVLRSEIMAIPVAISGTVSTLVTANSVGDDRNVLVRGNSPGLTLARTTDNLLAWRISRNDRSCTFQIVSLSD